MRIAVISFSDLNRDPRVRREVEAFAAEGWEVRALVNGGYSNHPRVTLTLVPIERRRAGTLRYLAEYAGFLLWAFAWVLRLVVRGGVDVVYVNSPPDILSLAALPARLRQIPVVLDIHDPMPELFTAKGRRSGVQRKLLELQEKAGIRLADVLITVHEPMRRLLKARHPGRDIEVVMNVPDTSQLTPLAQDPESRLLVFAGTVAFRYGLDDVVKAMSIVRDEISGIGLRVIGEGEDLERLRQLAARLEVPVEFVGAVPWDEVRSHQEGAWAGVNVPKPDALGELSFSNKIVEWVAMGLPVIASRTSTLLTYFPSESLEYVEGGDVESVARGLLRLNAMSPEDRLTRVERAKEALASIAWPVQRETLLGLIRGLVQSG